MEHVVSAFGLFALVGVAWVFSADRRAISWRLVGMGLALQLSFALIVHVLPIGKDLFQILQNGVSKLLEFTFVGSRFLFGDLMEPGGPVGFVFAFRVLPTIVFFSALMGVLYHLGIMQRLVLGMARLMHRTMGVSGAESLSVAANVFVGQTEAPLVVRPYVPGMTRSELMVLMTGGMATIAGGVLAGYISFGIDAGHLLAASVMSAPAALVAAKILIPESEKSATAGEVKMHSQKTSVNVVDAAADGATQGLSLALNVGAMLLAFLALVAVIDGGLGVVAGWIGRLGWTSFPSSLQEVFGIILWPIAWCLGAPASEAAALAALIGEKLTLTEFVAYAHLGEMHAAGEISDRTAMLGTYALCGFANFGSIGIQIGGIGALAESRRHDLAKLSLRAMLGGALASAMTAAVAGIFL